LAKLIGYGISVNSLKAGKFAGHSAKFYLPIACNHHCLNSRFVDVEVIIMRFLCGVNT